MTKNITCDSEHFAIGMEELFADIEPNIAKELSTSIPKVARKGAKRLREEAKGRWKGVTGQRYAAGFSSKTIKTGTVTTAEIGNKNMPGLVHLLEKGHETLTSRRVAGIPHVAPVYQEIEPEVIEAVTKAVGDALED